MTVPIVRFPQKVTFLVVSKPRQPPFPRDVTDGALYSFFSERPPVLRKYLLPPLQSFRVLSGFDRAPFPHPVSSSPGSFSCSNRFGHQRGPPRLYPKSICIVSPPFQASYLCPNSPWSLPTRIGFLALPFSRAYHSSCGHKHPLSTHWRLPFHLFDEMCFVAFPEPRFFPVLA